MKKSFMAGIGALFLFLLVFAGIYVKIGKEPAMYDPYTGTEYIPENP